ncbi:hypothetical protein [Xanthomonas nasturtii]|uniref:hypothetical protein n=1 Tax=Xanthomonas nasturtii TaxID=1843581 RepID=UPI0020121C22|nr:hypothetical protein [Xanthomonas nasturtii]MCL1498463.1 hypothetical protein [Xanthomonas nasturtii]MCL1502053.1 hypothetical protein [Xanthomonas nasturtii]MCL1521687.1 hypothetical protein [Xanthomonas nasturtii]MCL1558272.1 hypothetical protein [Xanthomonas nasturtii]
MRAVAALGAANGALGGIGTSFVAAAFAAVRSMRRDWSSDGGGENAGAAAGVGNDG